MKKTFLILAAAVVLSSVAFAKPYGEKSRPDSVGDIVFADGTATAWREGLVFTDAQKKAAVAVIFYAGTECSNSGGRRVLGVGLAQNQSGLAWCVSDAEAYNVNITTIQCEASGSAGSLTFSGDLDGSDNFGQIGAFLRENGIPDDTADESLYPAFYFPKNYAESEGSNVRGTKFESGWYLPTIAELSQIWKNRPTVNAAIEACGGTQFDLSKIYWSSSQYAAPDVNAYILYFTNGDWYGDDSGYPYGFACAVRAFNGEEKTMTVRENLKLRSGEATSTQVLAVMSAGAKVRILELGKAETIDGIPSNWVKVEVQQGAKDRDGKPIKKGTVGWCFGGYLE